MRQYTPFISLAFLQRFYNLVRASHPELEKDSTFMTNVLALVDDEVCTAIRAEREGTFPKLDAMRTGKWRVGIDEQPEAPTGPGGPLPAVSESC